MARCWGNQRLTNSKPSEEERRRDVLKRVKRSWDEEKDCHEGGGEAVWEECRALEGKYLIRSCVRVLKDSVAELLTLASGEEIRVFSPCPDSEISGHRDPRIVATVCRRPVVKPSKTCLFTLRPKMDLSSSGTYSCKRGWKCNEYGRKPHRAISEPWSFFDKLR